MIAIKCVSRYGFRLMNDVFVYGPVALFPKTVLSWRVRSPDEITPESVEFFTMLEPKLDVLVVGAGDRKYVDPVRLRIAPYLAQHNIGLEILHTASF